MSLLWLIFGVTALVLVGLISWVVWLNWIDRKTENTIGRNFDYYEHPLRGPREDD